MHDDGAQCVRIAFDAAFQRRQTVGAIVQRHGDRQLAEIRGAEENPYGGCCAVMDFVTAGLGVGDRRVRGARAAIEQVDALAAHGEPGAAVDPWAPTRRARSRPDRLSRPMRAASARIAAMSNGRASGEATEIDVRSRLGAAAHLGAAQHDGGDAVDRRQLSAPACR